MQKNEIYYVIIFLRLLPNDLFFLVFVIFGTILKEIIQIALQKKIVANKVDKWSCRLAHRINWHRLI